MNAVGKLGSYISKSVYTVSGPFHPFGGAVDIIVVEQPDGSFKSSPWYVKFGKFQGVLKTKEKVVTIDVNDTNAGFNMYLDHKGEAYFLREMKDEEGESLISPSSSGEDTDEKSRKRRSVKSRSWDCDVGSETLLDVSTENVYTRASSKQSRILGLMFGRKSMKGNKVVSDEENGAGIVRAESLEHAQIAADLLEVKWSTNLDSPSYRCRKNNTSLSSAQNTFKDEMSEDIKRYDGQISENIVGNQNNLENFDSANRRVGSGVSGSEVGHSGMLHVVSKPDSEVNFQPEPSTLKEPLDSHENFKGDNQQLETERTSPNLSADNVVTAACAQMVTFHQSDEELGPRNVFTIASISNSTTLVQGNICVRTEEEEDAQKPIGESLVLNFLQSEISEEEQLLFGDFNECALREDKSLELLSQKEEDIHLTRYQRGKEETNESSVLSHDLKAGEMKDVRSSGIVQHQKVPRMARSLPNDLFSENMDSNDFLNSTDFSKNSSSEISRRSLLREDVLGSVKARASNDDQSTLSPYEREDGRTYPAVGDRSKSMDPSSGSWKMWPFPSKKSGSKKGRQPAANRRGNSDAEIILKSPDVADELKDAPIVKVTKKKTKTLTPTSEQLATLNLKEGSNKVIFTFSTPMLGKQQVDARIYLWRWDTRIVISDVDGTITRSDVLGQFMPLVGVDWSQTGVTHLFSAIKENGYQLLFLSARAISQSYHTRQFLFNLKQDGKSLPDGPVVISPDGLFPSLFREVVRRAPHEFKIACLEDIKALFPSESNPFYAGFGNRDTDELSYLKVGIPIGKIFIINPKGEVVVNRHINTKSYTSLHALVNGVFPPTSSSEQEDFNSWNYWKLPPAAINI